MVGRLWERQAHKLLQAAEAGTIAIAIDDFKSPTTPL